MGTLEWEADQKAAKFFLRRAIEANQMVKHLQDFLGDDYWKIALENAVNYDGKKEICEYFIINSKDADWLERLGLVVIEYKGVYFWGATSDQHINEVFDAIINTARRDARAKN